MAHLVDYQQHRKKVQEFQGPEYSSWDTYLKLKAKMLWRSYLRAEPSCIIDQLNLLLSLTLSPSRLFLFFLVPFTRSTYHPNSVWQR
jgi:hypothetical protein